MIFITILFHHSLKSKVLNNIWSIISWTSDLIKVPYGQWESKRTSDIFQQPFFTVSRHNLDSWCRNHSTGIGDWLCMWLIQFNLWSPHHKVSMSTAENAGMRETLAEFRISNKHSGFVINPSPPINYIAMYAFYFSSKS